MKIDLLNLLPGDIIRCSIAAFRTGLSKKLTLSSADRGKFFIVNPLRFWPRSGREEDVLLTISQPREQHSPHIDTIERGRISTWVEDVSEVDLLNRRCVICSLNGFGCKIDTCPRRIK